MATISHKTIVCKPSHYCTKRRQTTEKNDKTYDIIGRKTTREPRVQNLISIL